MLAAFVLCAAACAAPFAADRGKEMEGSIWDMSDQQLAEAQAKITYLGPQTKPVYTVVFSVEGHKPAMVRFLDVQRPSKPYGNDELPGTKIFSISAEEFRRLLSAVKPVFDSMDAREPASLSFSALTGAGAALFGQEFLIPYSSCRSFYTAVLGSLDDENVEGRSIIDTQFRNVCPE